MRTSRGAFAYIVRQVPPEEREYLVQWNPNWKAFNFIGGGVEPGESFRECCVREIAEELAIEEHIGYHVADQPLAHLEYQAFSESAGQETAYVFELFETQLRPEALSQVTEDPQNQWVNANEILAGFTRDGRKISRTVAQVLCKAHLLSGQDSASFLKGSVMAKKVPYTPQPLDIRSVTLPESLVELTEKLAEHIHDTWAAQRMKDGWVYGKVRDDSLRQHPCLIPYDQLSEEEKEYDRLTALGTLKAILLLGYRIDPPLPGASQ